MENKIVNANTIFDFNTKWTVNTLKGKLEEAEKAYRNQVNSIIDKVITYLNDNPGKILTVVDIAEITGLSRSVVVKKLDTVGWNRGLASEVVYVTRYFAQVDKDGNLIPNGKTMKQKIRMRGYRRP